ncbi:MAG TPA: M48 family metalloprotease [Acidisarcina sp.]|nr:M48 family metalloprotease [Acidisarcina sp.]
MTLRKLWMTSLLLCLTVVAAEAKKAAKFEPATPLTADQSALIQKAVAREKITIKAIQKRTPLVETYIQNMRPDPKLYAVPLSDQYLLSRVDFGRTFTDKSYDSERSENKGFLKGSLKAITGLSKAFKLEYVSTGFMQMMFVDPVSFDQQHYDFAYVRRDFLGSVRTMVFDVHPKPGLGSGRFSGRIWIEDQDGNIVRFNGTYTGNSEDESPRYFHFDSWRMNLQPDVWLPVAVYAEETQRGDTEKAVGFRAQTHFWGYSLKLPTHDSDNASIKIDDVTDKSDQSSDVSPLQAQRAWISQAEENVLDRLVQAGLIAPPSDFDKVLETITNNIVIGNNLALTENIKCRVMLTAPLESLAVGNTILLSKGLIDVLPSEEGVAAVLSFELAHIVLGHHIDTRYAFNDRLLFPDEATFSRINMQHSDTDDTDAAKTALKLLNNSVYKDKLPNAGLFFAQLQARGKELSALNSPRLGDGLLRADGTPWLSDLMKGSPKLDQDKLDQIAALPLGSRLKTDPWDDKVVYMNVKPVPLLNARDKMPLELTPIILKLSRYAPPTVAPAPAAPATGTASAEQAPAAAQ